MKPLIIGHRGASAHAPENTMAAFRLALEQGADGVEFDVRLSRDGIPVVIHDDTLKRTGAHPAKVSSLTLSELKKIDVGGWFKSNERSYQNEPLPTLSEVFELFAKASGLLYLEMKSEPDCLSELAEACCHSLRQSTLKSRVIVECFDLNGIQLIKQLDSDIKTAALFEPNLRTPPGIKSSKKLIDKALSVEADEIALHHRLASPRTVLSALDAGLNVVVWTVDDAKWINLATSRNIAALITNTPERMIGARSHVSRI